MQVQVEQNVPDETLQTKTINKKIPTLSAEKSVEVCQVPMPHAVSVELPAAT
jgi:hypothetical protein